MSAATVMMPDAWAAPAPREVPPQAMESKAAAAEVGAALSDAPVEVVVLPVEITTEGTASAPGVRRRRAEIEALLSDTAQDLGLALDVGSPIGTDAPLEDYGLPEMARRSGRLLIHATIHVTSTTREDGFVELRLVAARPDTRTLVTRVERVRKDDLPVRTVVMLRDLVTEIGRQRVVRVQVTQRQANAAPEHSMGRAILAVTGTAYGGYLGFALQRASGSEDPRLLYPLVGVGAGVGLGAAILVADEWDVSLGDAWYLSSGAFWPAVGSQLIYEGRFGAGTAIPEGEQWGFSLVASAAGLGLATVGLLQQDMREGGAALALSGGGAGMLLGGMAEMMVTGSDEEVPLTGMGYGAIGGWLVGAATAMRLDPAVIDVLAIDLGLTIGAVGGAAAASPLLLDSPGPAEVRGWVGAAAGGMALGTALAVWLTSDGPDAAQEEGEPPPGGPEQVVARWRLPTPTLLTSPSAPPAGWSPDRSQQPAARPRPTVGVGWSAELW